MGYRFNPPPGWPPIPDGWQPDPSWPAAPAGWPYWTLWLNVTIRLN
jgi:hypothetical protein